MTAVLAALAIAIFASAAVTDVMWRRIANPLVAALAGVGLCRILLEVAAGGGAGGAGADVLVACAVFAAGAGVFCLNLIGGGDVKLLAAGALWVGAAATGQFLMITVLAGGALAVLFLAGAMLWNLVAGSRLRPSLPYGAAIAAGGILSTATSLSF